MFLREVKIPNGGLMVLFEIYQCDDCGEEIPENHPHYAKNNQHYCLNCSFVNGYTTEKEYLNSIGIAINNAHADIIDNRIIVWIGNKPPHERKDKDYRNTNQYKEWRQKVFERDNFICQSCFTRGGNLEAHHIKTFHKHKNLRFDIANGITYCRKCHRQKHKKACNAGRVVNG